jgi:hypothetical protein
MIRNPEFRRNVWLEVTPQRLAISPILVVLLYVLALITFDEANPRSVGAMAARCLFFVWALIWGSAKVRGSFVSEFSERTWDTQRMSALAPWSLAWGKILGSTILPWAGASTALVLFLYDSVGEVRTPALLIELGIWLVLALGLHGLVAFLTVLDLRRPEVRRGGRGGHPLSSSFALLLFGGACFWRRDDPDVYWYAASFSVQDFALVSMAAWSGWAWLGLQRVLSTELQLRVRPWAWWSFLVFVSVFFGGFLAARIPNLGVGSIAVVGFGVGLLFAYVAAYFDRRDPVDLRAFGVAIRNTDLRQALERVPLFVGPAALGLLCIVPASLLVHRGARGWLEWTSEHSPMAVGALGLTALFVMLRDVGLLYRFSLGARPERAETNTLLLMFLLSVLLPSLFSGFGSTWLAALALPFLLWKVPLAALGVAGFQLAIVGVILARRLRGHATSSGHAK